MAINVRLGHVIEDFYCDKTCPPTVILKWV
jgi:hypothetical protein